MELRSNRIILRKLKDTDANDIYKNAKDKEVVRFTLNIPHPYLYSDATKFISSSIIKWNKKENFTFGITPTSTNKVIGIITLKDIDWRNKKAELGYWLGKKYWGKGIMTEAVGLILCHGFRDLKLHRIYAYIFEKNTASEKVLRKSGFTLEGKKRDVRFRNGKWHNELMFSILRKEYH
jgi:RimJ/RimL family protein N-acetyltransferase